MEKHVGDINALLGQAIARLQQGKLAESEVFFQKILDANPEHADAHHLLGVIAMQRGQHDLAVQLITKAIKYNPGAAIYFNNLCHSLHAGSRLEEALTACGRAIQLDPNLPEAFYNGANTLKSLGRSKEALAAYERAIQLRPEYADAHYNRGNVLLASGRAGEAEASYRRVLALNPNHAGASSHLAVVLANTGKLDEALTVCEQAIRLMPNYPQAHNCRGDVLRKQSQLKEALLACEKAIELRPQYTEAYYNRGNILLDAGRAEEAEASYRHALELKPDDAQLHSNILFIQAARARLNPTEMLAGLRQWDRIHGEKGCTSPMPKRTESIPHARRSRIGYVSPHLRSSVVSFFFEPLLAAHDRNQFEIFCYASFQESRSDATTQRLRGIAEHWRFVNDLNDEELARLIHQDGIDILVDLAGHASNNRLKAFAYRPAPVQATYLGFFAGTGLEAMDYWITDEILHPQDTQELAAEEIYRLPRCWVCYQPPGIAPDVAPCPNANTQVVFGSFSNLSKLAPEVIETWARLLLKLPESRLLLMAKALKDAEVQSRLIGEFASHGIPPERLLLRKGAAYSQYFATYAEVDIVLDPFPRTGGTTTAEALWMGVPVVTLAGQRYVERISASKLTAVGLTDLIAGTREEYIEKALSLACDPARRIELRANLREKMARSPLRDGVGLARAMESAYKTMWKRFLSKRS